MSEVDETMKRLQSHKGVTGLIVIDKEGYFEPLRIKNISIIFSIFLNFEFQNQKFRNPDPLNSW